MCASVQFGIQMIIKGDVPGLTSVYDTALFQNNLDLSVSMRGLLVRVAVGFARVLLGRDDSQSAL